VDRVRIISNLSRVLFFLRGLGQMLLLNAFGLAQIEAKDLLGAVAAAAHIRGVVR
jgi:hypothetical protein